MLGFHHHLLKTVTACRPGRGIHIRQTPTLERSRKIPHAAPEGFFLEDNGGEEGWWWRRGGGKELRNGGTVEVEWSGEGGGGERSRNRKRQMVGGGTTSDVTSSINVAERLCRSSSGITPEAE
ncbi:hypothetical protein EYF80_048640 [Liparis tanakae]|uniref:Uncharacterized protein n=1 Tax=Liparis tanakae TaxID=230148 RepID=A0A4Z2FJS9_9TELE|nr:hypothetical protein EYF80_048640 [Liparis tanakae]